MNISSTVKKLFIIAGLGLSVSAWADTSVQTGSTATVNALKNVACSQHPWCGYIKGVSAANMAKTTQEALNVTNGLISHCADPSLSGWLDSKITSCASTKLTAGNQYCEQLFNAIGSPCAPDTTK